MKLKLSLFLTIFTVFQIYSQIEKHIQGKVVSNEIAVKSVDIVNLNTKINTTTDKNGNFNIKATVNDVLIFISSDYHDFRLMISNKHLNNNLIINLEKKPIELQEVIIEENTNFKGVANYNDMKIAKIEKDQSRPKVVGVYTGEIVNGMDFVEIGKKIIKLFKGKKKKPITKEEEIDYQQFIESVFNEDFFVKTLQLKPDQTESFLDYVLSDKNVLEVIRKKNKFEMMNVLIIKNEDFKKLKQ